MKSKHTCLALALILVGAAIGTEPESKPAPPADARLVVQTQIVARLRSSFPPFSRVAPPQPEALYHDLILADGEQRLPFEVREPRALRTSLEPGPSILVSGYVRLSDKAVFIFDPKTQKHIPATLDPRFAPPGEKANSEKPA